jgi:hypothetical protein
MSVHKWLGKIRKLSWWAVPIHHNNYSFWIFIEKLRTMTGNKSGTEPSTTKQGAMAKWCFTFFQDGSKDEMKWWKTMSWGMRRSAYRADEVRSCTDSTPERDNSCWLSKIRPELRDNFRHWAQTLDRALTCKHTGWIMKARWNTMDTGRMWTPSILLPSRKWTALLVISDFYQCTHAPCSTSWFSVRVTDEEITDISRVRIVQ